MSPKLTQIHDMETCTPVEGSNISIKQRAETLASLLLMTGKRDGIIKGRQCADLKNINNISKRKMQNPQLCL